MPSASQASRFGGGRQLLGIEAALGAGRDDHRILDHLRLHQAEDLGAEIVAPVGPAEAAAGDRAAAQVDALDARLNRPRSRATAPARGRPGTSDELILNASASLGGFGAKALVRTIASTSARSRRRMRSSSIERTWASASSNSLALLVDLRLALAAGAGSWRGGEQLDQRRRRLGRPAQRVDDGDQAERAPGLAQVAEPGAQPDAPAACRGRRTGPAG